MLLLECLKERIIIIAHRFEEWKNVCLCVSTQRIPTEHDGTRRGCIKIRCIYRVPRRQLLNLIKLHSVIQLYCVH